MERWYLRRDFAFFDEFIRLETALLTKAHWAYIPTAIALDALGKFKIPLIVKSLLAVIPAPFIVRLFMFPVNNDATIIIADELVIE